MLLIDKILRNSYSKRIRNLFGIRPSFDLIDYTSEGISASDAFFGEQIKILRQFLGLLIF